MRHARRFLRWPFALLLWGATAAPPLAYANGVSDDRVSLPDGPGSISGLGENLEIDPNMGQMHYQVPIELPRGYAGATPNLDLSYGSGGESSALGVGWSLPLPFIERSTARGLPRYNAEDSFVADGSTELVKVSGATYRARFEKAFVRYSFYDAGAAGYWTAEHPDGSVQYFGATAAGTVVENARVERDNKAFRYQLVESVDVHGHRVRYEYDKLGGMTPLLSRVSYVFVDDVPRYTVELDYERRDDVLSDCAPSFELTLAHRLVGVRVHTSGVEIARYGLGYESYDSSGGVSRLMRITRYGADGKVYPGQKRFGYSRSIGSSCPDCTGAQLVDMGTPAIGAAMASGRATLVDINADGLPDLVHAAGDGSHTFFQNQLGDDLQPSFASAGTASAVATAETPWDIALPSIQAFDVDGDGLTDLYDRLSGTALCNKGTGDWSTGGCLGAKGSGDASFTDDPDDDDGADDPDPSNVRFLDYDNDKRIDWIRTDSDQSTMVFVNSEAGFVAQSIDPVGFQFDDGDDHVTPTLADLNGDGLQDPARVIVTSATEVKVEYRLNLGFGVWGPLIAVPFNGVDLQNARIALEDLNGDGADDVVAVTGSAVRFAVNRNGNRFDDFVTISAQAGAELEVPGLPSYVPGQSVVLFADMNGSGTRDIVWIEHDGHVRFLELFRVRPNLLDRIENGLGGVQTVRYGTAAEQRALAASGGETWTHMLAQPMTVVVEKDTWTTLTGGEDGAGLHELETFRYRNGHYDGVLKQFRGFGEVTRTLAPGESQEEGAELLSYDLAIDDPYRNGLLLAAAHYADPSGDRRLLQRVAVTYEDCPVAGVPDSVLPAVRHVCETAREVLVAEGAPEAEQILLRTEKSYDGYGHVIVEKELGVSDRDGDERITETQYSTPGDSAAHAWLHGLPIRVEEYGHTPELRSVTVSHYDGAPFVGLEEGGIDKGLLSRVVQFVSATESIDAERSAFDAHGNVIETLDPDGDPDEPNGHRRRYTFDRFGLHLVRAEIRLETEDGEPYSLVRELTYHPQYDKVASATGWMVEQGGALVTPKNQITYAYDGFQRLTSLTLPGDTPDAPSQDIAWELSSPVSRVVVRQRSQAGAAADLERVECRDGLGRTVQTRTALGDGRYQVDGFMELNSRGNVVRAFQAFVSDSGDCDRAPPGEGVLATHYRYDAKGREVEVAEPDADLYDGPSTRRTRYAPLVTYRYDAEDTDPESPHFNTPFVERTDGLGRLVEVARYLDDADDAEPASLLVERDGLGRMTAYVDALGNRKEAEYDLVGRTLRVLDPNAGEIQYAYDPAGNLIARTDARGLRVESRYDGMNRLVQQLSGDDAQDSVGFRYDFPGEGCALEDCRQTAGQLARRSFLMADGSVGYRDAGYDARGNVVYENLRVAGQDLWTRNTFDDANRLVQVQSADGQVVKRQYDGASRLSAVEGVVARLGYEARGPLSEILLESGVFTEMAYDARIRLAKATTVDAEGSAFLDFAYERDRSDNLRTIVDAGLVPSTQRFAYDAWYRPMSASFEAGESTENETLSYAYDAIDRVLARTSSLGAESPAHLGALKYGSAAPQALSSAGGIARTYDAAGQLTRRGALELTWNYRGLLVGIADAQGEQQLSYDENGLRVSVERPGWARSIFVNPDFEVHDGISVVYVRDGMRRFARVESDALAAQFFPDGDGDGHIGAHDAYLAAAQVEGQPRGDMLRSAARRLLLEARGSLVYLHQDHIHSVLAASDAEGHVTASRAYYPNGRLQRSSGFVDRYGFTGQPEIEGTDFIQFRARLLDAQSGRFISVDPAFEAIDDKALTTLGDGTSAYAYVANRGVNTYDPTGFNPPQKGMRQYRHRGSSASVNAHRHSVSMSSRSRRSSSSYMVGYHPPAHLQNRPTSHIRVTAIEAAPRAPVKASGSPPPMGGYASASHAVGGSDAHAGGGALEAPSEHRQSDASDVSDLLPNPAAQQRANNGNAYQLRLKGEAGPLARGDAGQVHGGSRMTPKKFGLILGGVFTGLLGGIATLVAGSATDWDYGIQ